MDTPLDIISHGQVSPGSSVTHAPGSTPNELSLTKKQQISSKMASTL